MVWTIETKRGDSGEWSRQGASEVVTNVFDTKEEAEAKAELVRQWYRHPRESVRVAWRPGNGIIERRGDLGIPPGGY
jgi:hypothetical protein